MKFSSISKPVLAAQTHCEQKSCISCDFKNSMYTVTGTLKQIYSWFNWLYAQLHYFLNLSQLLVSCLPLLDKLISHGNNNQTHLN